MIHILCVWGIPPKNICILKSTHPFWKVKKIIRMPQNRFCMISLLLKKIKPPKYNTIYPMYCTDCTPVQC